MKRMLLLGLWMAFSLASPVSFAQQIPSISDGNAAALFPGPPKSSRHAHSDPNYRDEIRFIVMELSRYAKTRSKNFIIMGMGSPELLAKTQQDVTWERWSTPNLPEIQQLPLGAPWPSYLSSLDGFLLDSTFCFVPTTADIRGAIGPISPDQTKEKYEAELERGKQQALLNHIKREIELASFLQREGGAVFAVNRCGSPAEMETALSLMKEKEIAGYATAHVRFADIPVTRPLNENAATISALSEVKTILPLMDLAINSGEPGTRPLRSNNYDLLIISPLLRAPNPMTAKDVHALKHKALGSRRLVLAALSLTVAESAAYYWKSDWRAGDPSWLVSPSKRGEGMVVRYWDPAWKKILGEAIQGIIDMGFDGVVLTNMDSYRVFEAMDPLLE